MAKKFLATFLSLLMVILLTACTAEENKQKDDKEVLSFKRDVLVNYEITNLNTANAFMGFAPEATEKSVLENCSLVYVDVTFRELQPENENTFDFSTIEKENNLNYWREQGKHVVFRFVCDIPRDYEHMDIPDWLYDKINGDGTKYNSSYGKGFSPNYNNEVFIDYHKKAIEALGDYFGKDNFFSFVELGSLGHWGEWHVDYEAGITRLPKSEVREKYVAPYITAFPNSKILMRRPFESASKNGFGLFNDMAGEPESTSAWLDWIENGGDFNQAQEKNALVPMGGAWKVAPIGGEFNSDLAMDYMLKTNLKQTVDLIATSHTTFLGPKTPLSSSGKYDNDQVYQNGVQSVLSSMGYKIGVTKLEISKASKNNTVQVNLTWTNKGVAPIYFDLPVYIYVLDSNNEVITRSETDLKLTSLLPKTISKTSTKISFNSNPGVKVAVGIIDPMTNKPSVLLSNNVQQINGFNVLYEY